MPASLRRRPALPNALRALRHRDFRLFWLGAFFSFVGSWVQTTGQQWLVYDITRSEQALGLITFIGASPMFFLSPFGGWLADRSNKRAVLIFASAGLSVSAFILAASVQFGFVSFWLIALLAFFGGCISVIEIPTRQSIISEIVPPEDLANAVPLNAMTFNSARIVGPAIGGAVLQYLGVAPCYLLNGISFAAIIFAALAIRADLRSTGDRSASLRESLFEGISYVFTNPAFRTVVSMMMTTAVFGLFYISQVSPLATTVLHAGESGYAALFISTGVGAVLGILTLAVISHNPRKGLAPLVSMVGVGASLIALSFCSQLWQAMICMGLMGLFGSGQMVGTNTTLQYFSPYHLRGRVISVHAWSLAGLSPVGALAFGTVSERLGLMTAFRIGGGVVLVVGVIALLFGKSLRKLGSNSNEPTETEEPATEASIA